MATPDLQLVRRFAANTAGRDFAVGDIHGHFSRLQAALNAIGFDPAVDRLFSVGDLVDRGPESHLAVDWLGRPWFHAVRGNHDDYVCRFDSCDTDNWLRNGGAWFMGLPTAEKQDIAAAFRCLPVAIEVATPAGRVGIVHADCPTPWDEMVGVLDGAHALSGSLRRSALAACLWSRTRFDTELAEPVHGVRAVVVGHNPCRAPVVLGNVYHIDTRGWRDDGHFTLLDLRTLECFPPAPARLVWED